MRILQVSPSAESLTIGTDRFNEMKVVNPVCEGKYYDWEFARLSQNLARIEETSVYEHISKLTPSSPIYHHFINSSILQIVGAHYFEFKVTISGKSTRISIPFTFVLKGLNIIQL